MVRKKKIAIILLSVFAGVFLIMFTAIMIATQSRNLFAGKVSDDGAFKTVMANIAGIVEADPRVVDIAMLGSHDANAYDFSKHTNFSGEVKNGVKPLYKMAPGLAYRYTKTQASDVYAQLNQGVRFLHIKCSYIDGEWYGSHSLVGSPVEVYIKDAIKFLKSSPGEIVGFELQVMYADGTNISQFVDAIFDIEFEGETLADFMPYSDVPLGELTYNDVTAHGTRGGVEIVVTADPEIEWAGFTKVQTSKNLKKIYTGWEVFYAPWFDRMNSSAIADALDEECKKLDDPQKYDDVFRVMQINTSPTGKDPFDTAFAWSLLNKAKKHNVQILNDGRFDKWLSHMPILLCDFSTSANGDFNKSANEKIISYNQDLVSRLLAQ